MEEWMNLSSLAGVLQVINHFWGKNRILGGHLPGSGGSQMDVEELDEPLLLDVFPGGDASICTFLWGQKFGTYVKHQKHSKEAIQKSKQNNPIHKAPTYSSIKDQWSKRIGVSYILYIYIYAYFMMLFLLRGFFPFFPAAFDNFRLDYKWLIYHYG